MCETTWGLLGGHFGGVLKDFRVRKNSSKNKTHIAETVSLTVRSLSNIFGDFFRDFWEGILGGVRSYSGGTWRSFWRCFGHF